MARFPCLPHAIILVFAFALVAEVIDAEAGGTHHTMGGEGSVRREDCPAKCFYRCSATSHRKPCMKYCIQCCSKCLCVPSGTYGNKLECPCYNNWKTQEGKPKCPSIQHIKLYAKAEVIYAEAGGTHHTMGGEGSVRREDCPPKCAYRCSTTSHGKPCMKYCIQCCSKCLCVPWGTYGNKLECPCYNNWKTQEGKPKCP